VPGKSPFFKLIVFKGIKLFLVEANFVKIDMNGHVTLLFKMP